MMFTPLMVALLVAAAGVGAWPRAASWAAPAHSSSSSSSSSSAGGGFSLLLLHTNDMHARFDETDKSSADCTPALKEKGRCYGGFARLAHALKEARAEATSGSGPPVVFLNAGDTYQGTVWYTVHKWRVVVKLLNMLAPDAVSLGNHEFDDGPQGLKPFLEEAKFPVVAANVNVSGEPVLRSTLLSNNLRPSVVLPVAVAAGAGRRQRVGVVGYLTPETEFIANPGGVTFEDEVAAVDREAKKLKAQGVEVIIAVGHSGFDVDKRIAERVADVDVVVGGHTNTFLFSPLDGAPDSERPQDLYPTRVTQPSGKVVPVVQAYAYTKYLGRLHLHFDAQGELHAFDGNPLLLNASVPQDPEMAEELNSWRGAVLAKTRQEVGRSGVFLNGSTQACRRAECNLGNVVADAFVAYSYRRYNAEDGEGKPWADAAIALQHSGGIRNSVRQSSSSSDRVTAGNLMAVLPFDNAIYRCSLAGSTLRSVLEHSVANYNFEGNSNGDFLQVSGLRVTFDLSQPVGARLRNVSALCLKCEVPEFEPLMDDASYPVLIPEFIVDGGNAYVMLKDLKAERCKRQNYSDYEALDEYVSKMSPVFAKLEGRITFDPPLDQVVQEAAATRNGLNSSTKVGPSSLLLALLLFLLSYIPGQKDLL